MKTVMVTMKVVDDDEARAIKKAAIQDKRLPVIGVITDDTGDSQWIGDEFLTFASKHLLDGNLPNNRMYFVFET